MENRGSPLFKPYLSLLILLAGEDTTDPWELKKMIVEVNSTQVAPEEVLSNSLYRYDRFEKRVEKIL